MANHFVFTVKNIVKKNVNVPGFWPRTLYIERNKIRTFEIDYEEKERVPKVNGNVLG